MATKEKSEDVHPKFSDAKLMKMLLDKDYCFPDSYFEPSNDKPISGKDKHKKNQLTLEALEQYLKTNYGTGGRLTNSKNVIEEIIGSHRLKRFIELIESRSKEIKKLQESKHINNSNKPKELINFEQSEYLKILTHFAILSKVKQGWYDLFLVSPVKNYSPSLSVQPSKYSFKKSKELNDAIIRCYYARLLQGMTKQDRDRYQILEPDEVLPSRFDRLLTFLDRAIQDLFCYAQQNYCGYYDDSLLPDTGLEETFQKMRLLLCDFFLCQNKEVYSVDSLRATLMKFASINFAINHIDANINMQNDDFEILPYDIRHLKQIKSESDILPAVSEIFSGEQKKLRKNLVECAKLVCKMHIIENEQYNEKAADAFKEFSQLHMTPFCIAVSAALLGHDLCRDKKLYFNTQGEPSDVGSVYKKLSDLLKKVSSADALTSKTLWDMAFPQEMFKYLTSRYSITVRSLSSDYSAQEIAEARMKVRRKKFELQRETYELLKDMSIQEISASIYDFCTEVNEKINSVGNTYNKLIQ